MDTKPVVDAAVPAGNTTGDTGYDDFANVFAELVAAPVVKHEDTTTAPTAVDAAAAAAGSTDEAAVADAAADTSGNTGEAPPLADAAGTGEPPPLANVAGTGDAPPQADPVKMEEASVDWKAKYEALQAEKAKVDVAAPAAPAAEAPPATPALPELYTTDEKEFLDGYGKEWPDVSRGEALRRRAEYRELASFIFNEISRVYGPVLLQAQQTTEQVADNTLLGFVQRHHQDYDDAMYDAVEAWVDGLSGMRKKVALAALKDGEPEDVVELITEFKQATGRKPVVVAPPEQNVQAAGKLTQAKKPELSDAAKKAAKALGGVDSKRSATTQGADPNDFDRAWAEATAAAT